MRALWLGATAAALAAALGAGSAAADGLVVKRSDPYVYVAPDAASMVYDWSGIYIGGHLGAGYSQVDWIHTGEPFDQTHTGFVGGGFAGLQKQWSWLVFGAEVGYLWMDQKESTGAFFSADTTASSSVRNMLLVTGKFGWANDNILAYFKGGYATAEVDFRTTRTSDGALRTSSSEREHGWTAGAGIEYALWQHVILGVEYNYVQLNTDVRTQTLAPAALPGVHLADGITDFQSITARLSFKIGGGRPEAMATK